MHLNRIAPRHEQKLRTLRVYFLLYLLNQGFGYLPGFIPDCVMRLEINHVLDRDFVFGWRPTLRASRSRRGHRHSLPRAPFIQLCLDQQLRFVTELHKPQVVAEPGAYAAERAPFEIRRM